MTFGDCHGQGRRDGWDGCTFLMSNASNHKFQSREVPQFPQLLHKQPKFVVKARVIDLVIGACRKK